MASCEKAALDNDDDSSINTPVVQSLLQPEHDIEVSLAYPDVYEDDTLLPGAVITGLDVFIIHDNESFLLAESQDEAGLYSISNEALAVTEGANYRLEFQLGGLLVSGETSIPSKPEGVSISTNELFVERIDSGSFGGGPEEDRASATVSWSNPSNGYYLVSAQYLEESVDPINANFEAEDLIFGSGPLQSESEELEVLRTLPYFGTYRIVVAHVNEEYTKLYESIGDNSLNITESISSIENGLGVFSGFTSDTLLLEVTPE